MSQFKPLQPVSAMKEVAITATSKRLVLRYWSGDALLVETHDFDSPASAFCALDVLKATQNEFLIRDVATGYMWDSNE
jgi:hypothetical protein